MNQNHLVTQLLIEKYNVIPTVTIDESYGLNLLECTINAPHFNSLLFQYLLNLNIFDINTIYTVINPTPNTRSNDEYALDTKKEVKMKLLFIVLLDRCRYTLDDLKCVIQSGADIHEKDEIGYNPANKTKTKS